MKLTNDNDETSEDSELARALAELPRSVEPSRDLWTALATRVEARRTRTLRGHRVAAGVALLLAAASVALAIRVAPGPVAAREGMTSPRSERGAVPSEGVHAAWDTDPVVPEEAAYHAAVAALTPTFEQRMRRLPQADANAIGKSVGAIDEAISATRASLEETPEDGGLRAELGNEYEQKIQTMNDVLDWTTRS